MVDVRIATGAEQPIHSDGAVSTVTLSEGDLVGLDSSGELVAADAAVGTAVPAVGVSVGQVDDPTSYSGPTATQKEQEAYYIHINDQKAGYVRYGVELVNQDADWGFTQGEPVYLAEGGGFTQTKPSDPGDLVQRLGYAINDGEEVFLEIEEGYSTVDSAGGDATFSGDAAQTAFDIAHGLTSTPSVYEVQPTSAEAAAEHYVSAVDGTNITVTFTTAPADATDNVTFNWSAEE